MIKSPRGFWVSLDGRDTVGKSTQLPKVVQTLRAEGVYPVTELVEFSASPVGQTIRNILQENRFHALADNKTSPLADALHLLTDMLYQYETAVIPTIREGGIAVVDRGFASFVAYQATAIAEASPLFNNSQAFSWAATIAKHCLITPDLSILIRISEAEMKRRVVQRGEEPLSTDELEFLYKIDQTMLQAAEELGGKYVVVDGEQAVEDVTAEIVHHILQYAE